MAFKEVMAELKKSGSEQTAKTYRRHGATGEVYGVSYATFGAMKKKLKTDHALAQQLWDSGVQDARVLATMIADPQHADAKLLQKWASEAGNYGLVDAVAGVAARSPAGRKFAEACMKSKHEYVRRCGWSTFGAMLALGYSWDDADCAALLDKIEKEIHKAPNRAREAMHSALIAIGGYREGLRKDALAAAKRIGKVEIDHGDTSCKTPDAAEYIAKIAARNKPKSKDSSAPYSVLR